MSLFDNLSGADIDRLNDCIKAVGKAGLSLGKYTQAGLNPNSGNVWLWDEVWEGSVYCSIGFDVWWLWSCPECGEEHEFESYQDLVAFVDSQRELFDDQCYRCADADDAEAA
jgi:hypothetical protein